MLQIVFSKSQFQCHAQEPTAKHATQQIVIHVWMEMYYHLTGQPVKVIKKLGIC